MRRIGVLGVTALPVIFAAIGFSQTAQLTGTVSDTTGSLIPNAKLTAVDLDTRVARSTLSNESGNYLITALLPGRYEVTAARPGFKQVKLGPITLAVDQVGGINFTLEVGATQETVTVEASSVLLETASSTVGSLVDEGRNCYQRAPGCLQA